MSICDPVEGMHSLFPGLVAEQLFLPRPAAATATIAEIEAWTRHAQTLLDEHHESVAAIVIEPVLQGAGGMHVYPSRCVTELRRLADRYGMLLIADEIATGFGRTGTMFACEHAAWPRT